MIYLSFALGMVAKDHVSHVGNDKLMNEAVKKILIPVPPKEIQDKFGSYVEEIDKLKFEASERKKKVEIEKENLIDKYFR